MNVDVAVAIADALMQRIQALNGECIRDHHEIFNGDPKNSTEGTIELQHLVGRLADVDNMSDPGATQFV